MVLKALPQVAKFAQAGMFDMARATELLTDAQSALGLTVSDAQQNMLNMVKVGDVLVKANTLANASVEQFADALTTKAGAALKVLEKDIEEGVAVLAAFADQGVKASDAGTGLNIVLRDLSTKAIKNKAAFAAAGVAVFDAMGDMRNLAHIIADVEDALGGMSDEQKKASLLTMGFSDRSVIFLQTLLGLSRQIQVYESALRRAGGTMKAVAEKQLTPFERSVARIGAAWVRLSDSLQPLVSAASHFIAVVADKLEGLTRVLTPALVTQWLTGMLNTMDSFLRIVMHKITVFSLAVNETLAAIFEGLPFVGVPDYIQRNVQLLRRDVARQSEFLLAVNRGESWATGQLWGEVAGRAIAAPMREAMRQLHREQKVAWRDTIAVAFERARFEWERLLAAPGRTIMKWLGYPGPKALPALGDIAQPLAGMKPARMTRFAEVSLSRQAIMGANIRGLGGQLVRDPQLQETNRLLTQVADNTRTYMGGVVP